MRGFLKSVSIFYNNLERHTSRDTNHKFTYNGDSDILNTIYTEACTYLRNDELVKLIRVKNKADDKFNRWQFITRVNGGILFYLLFEMELDFTYLHVEQGNQMKARIAMHPHGLKHVFMLYNHSMIGIGNTYQQKTI